MKKLGWLFCALLASCVVAAAAGEIVERVVAVVGKEPILLSSAQTQLALAMDSFGVSASDTASVRKLRDQVLEEMIDQEVVYQEAQARGIVVADASVQAATDEMMDRGRQQFNSEQAFQDQLRREGLTEDELRERYSEQARRELAIGQLLRREFPDEIPVTDEEVQQFFDQHRSELPQREEYVHLEHILIRVTPDTTVTQKALALAKEVAGKIRSGELDFAAAARRYSDDASGRSGGDLGRVQRGDFVGRMGPEFEDSLFALPVGRVSDPLPSPLGYHLLQVSEKDPAGSWVHAGHILFGVPVVRADQVRADERAQQAYAALTSGKPFEDVARAFSDDPVSGPSGGDVGFVPLSALDGELRIVRDVVDTLDVGETSTPVAGEGAYHIFRLLGREKERPYEFSELSTRLVDYVRAEKQQARYRDWVTDLKNRYYIERREWE